MSNYQTPPSRYYSRPSRPHDYVYDPVYTTSSQKDFYKDASAGSRSGARIHLRPVYDSMFSELKRDVRIQACLTMPQPNLMTNFMPQYNINGVPVLPMDIGPPYPNIPDVTGADRAIYAMKYLPQNFQMERNTLDFTKASIEEKRKRTAAAGQKRMTRGAFVSRGVQTDYRESESQTDPYSPPYTLPFPGAYPKVMALINLTWGNGLPASLEDIVVIERALERRLLEVSHRNLKDEADFEKRVKLMEELEAQRWADREKELQKILEQKLDVTYKLLTEMYNKTSSDHTLRLERLHDNRKDAANRYIKAQKNRYIREIRKMEDLYLGPEKKFKRDIMKDYTDFNSQMYAPFLRNGRNNDMLYNAPAYEFDLHHNFEGLNQMITNSTYIQNEMFFDVREFGQKVRRLQPTSSVQRLEKKLLDTFHAFRAELEGKSKRANKYDDIIQKAKLTGPMDYQLDKEEAARRNKYVEEKDIASVTLQKIARGRIIQEEMRAELNRNMTTLMGMKTMYDMDPHGLRVGENTHPQVLSIKQERDAYTATEAPVTEILDQLEGETLARMLDFLDKEMVRLLDERKIHSLLLIADRERRMREACEAGRRQHEEQNRRANDEIFRQIVGINQSTVDIYLEEAYLESINRFADEHSREYVQKLAEALNQATFAQVGQVGEYEREELAAELVSCFIMPELNRIYNREAMHSIQKRYDMAAEQVTEGVFNAFGIINEILQDMRPVLGEHLQRGSAAIDGSGQIVDQIILNAVANAMKMLPPSAFSSPGKTASPRKHDGSPGKSASPRKPGGAGKTASPSKRDGSPGKKASPSKPDGSPGKTASPSKPDGRAQKTTSPTKTDGKEQKTASPSKHDDSAGKTAAPSKPDDSAGKEEPKKTDGKEQKVASPTKPDSLKRDEAAKPPSSAKTLSPEANLPDSAQPQVKVAEPEGKIDASKKGGRPKIQPSVASALQTAESGRDKQRSGGSGKDGQIKEPQEAKEGPVTPIRLDSEMKDLLGLKSIEVKYDTEMCQKAIDLYDGACTAVEDIFEDLKTTVVPKSEKDELSDQELNSEDD